jgi:hypothetical protein
MSEYEFRVLITGSRDWDDSEPIRTALSNAFRAIPIGSCLKVVHGDCPTGADAMASEWVKEMQTQCFPVFEEPHPAIWLKHGKAAGPIRNQEMVDLGADICFAFPVPSSRGTIHCMGAAEKAGIPVVNLGVK